MNADESIKIEKEMYDVANKIVGNVGTRIDRDFIKYRHSDIALFCFDCKPDDPSKIFGIWETWIKAYCVFKKHHTPEMLAVKNDPDLIVHWWLTPSIDVVLEGSSFVRIRAYLLVDRLDLYPTEIERNVA